MKTPAQIKDHPIHPMLVGFPIGLWVFSFVCDLIYHLGGGNPVWATVAFYSMAGGVVGAVLAAVPGFIDWLSIRDRNAKRIGLIHMLLNVAALILFGYNLYLRTQVPPTDGLPLALSLITIVGLAVSGWLGGTLVYRYHVSVSEPPEAEVARTGSLSTHAGPGPSGPYDLRQGDRRIRRTDRRTHAIAG